MQSQAVPTCWEKGKSRTNPPLPSKWRICYRSRFSEVIANPIQDLWKTAKEAPVADTQTELETTFHRLADEWRNETWFISSIKKRISHQAHLKIIGLGRPAIPLIVREMRRSPDNWFWALEAITHEDPAPHAENMQQLADAWLAWAKKHGY